ncbi:MAG: outer membrane beta-barrel protein [Pseudomonadota bacterium]
MQPQTFLFTSAIATCAFLAPQASAEDFYVDLGYAELAADEDAASYSSPKLDTLSGHFGYALTPTFDIEGELLIGASDETSFARTGFYTDISSGEIRQDVGTTTNRLNFLAGGFAKANLPVSERITLFGRMGLATVETETDFTFETETSNTYKNTGAAYGVGAVFDINERYYARVDYTSYDLETQDLSAANIAIGVKF